MTEIQQKLCLIINKHNCTKCGKCYEICKDGAVERVKNQFCSKCIRYCISLDVPCNTFYYLIVQEKCTSCGKCIESCPVGAIESVVPKNENEIIE